MHKLGDLVGILEGNQGIDTGVVIDIAENSQISVLRVCPDSGRAYVYWPVPGEIVELDEPNCLD